MCGVQNTAVHRVLHLAGFDNRVDGQKVNFQRAAGHGVNTIHIGLRILQEYAAAPGCLHFSMWLCGFAAIAGVANAAAPTTAEPRRNFLRFRVSVMFPPKDFSS